MHRQLYNVLSIAHVKWSNCTIIVEAFLYTVIAEYCGSRPFSKVVPQMTYMLGTSPNLESVPNISSQQQRKENYIDPTIGFPRSSTSMKLTQ